MNIFNSKMFQLILTNLVSDKQLDNSLLEVVQNGFVAKHDCFFLKKMFEQQSHITASDFIDKTGYECFINSLHVDDYISNDFISQSLLFVNMLVIEWEKLNNNLSIEIILSETDFGINIKWHVIRKNEDWINYNELNNFGEGIMIYRSRNIPTVAGLPTCA